MENYAIESNSIIQSEKIEYAQDNETYIILLSYDKEIIIFNIKKTKDFKCELYEEKYTYKQLKQINQAFTQFSDLEQVKNLFLSLLKEKKIKFSNNQNILNLSFKNINGDSINLFIKKKEFIGIEKYDQLSEIVFNLINELKKLKEGNEVIQNEIIKLKGENQIISKDNKNINEENKNIKEENKKIKEENKRIIEENGIMKEQISKLIQFKTEVEEIIKKKKYEKYNYLKNSNILKDKKEVEIISKWIKPYKNIKYTQIYKATRDGGTGYDFHRYCDHKAPTLTLIESTNEYIFGGFTSLTWKSYHEWTAFGYDYNAFIFSFNNKIKFNIKDKSRVIYDRCNYGPVFGYDDIYIKENFLTDPYNECNYNSYYNAKPEIIAGGKYFKVKELEVYTIQYE